MQFDFPNHEGKPYKSSGGEMVYNDLLKREIPKGWDVNTIGVFVDVRKGTTITKAQTKEGRVKVVAAATDYSFMHNESNRNEFVITVSSSGANAGYINFWREPIFASDCSTVQGESIYDTLFAYYWLIHFQEILFSQQIGAAQPHVYPEHIAKLPIVMPPKAIRERINGVLIHSNKQQHNCEVEIDRLQRLRDELLPMLLNGQVNCDLYYI